MIHLHAYSTVEIFNNLSETIRTRVRVDRQVERADYGSRAASSASYCFACRYEILYRKFLSDSPSYYARENDVTSYWPRNECMQNIRKEDAKGRREVSDGSARRCKDADALSWYQAKRLCPFSAALNAFCRTPRFSRPRISPRFASWII